MKWAAHKEGPSPCNQYRYTRIARHVGAFASKVLGKTKLRVSCLSQLLDPVMLQGLRAEEKEKGSG